MLQPDNIKDLIEMLCPANTPDMEPGVRAVSQVLTEPFTHEDFKKAVTMLATETGNGALKTAAAKLSLIG